VPEAGQSACAPEIRRALGVQCIENSPGLLAQYIGNSFSLSAPGDTVSFTLGSTGYRLRRGSKMTLALPSHRLRSPPRGSASKALSRSLPEPCGTTRSPWPAATGKAASGSAERLSNGASSRTAARCQPGVSRIAKLTHDRWSDNRLHEVGLQRLSPGLAIARYRSGPDRSRQAARR